MSAETSDRQRTARRFHEAMVDGYERLKQEIGYTATRFKQMVDADGGEAAAHALLAGPPLATHEGFVRLWEARRLEMSVEFFALLPEYEVLFSDEERATARTRLEAHGFNVGQALARHAEDPRRYP